MPFSYFLSVAAATATATAIKVDITIQSTVNVEGEGKDNNKKCKSFVIYKKRKEKITVKNKKNCREQLAHDKIV